MLLLSGFASAIEEYNTLDTDEIDYSEYEIDVIEYQKIQDFYDEISSHFEQMEYDLWEDGEKMLSDRITIGPVKVRNIDIAEYPKRREIYEPGTLKSWGSHWFGWLPPGLNPFNKGMWQQLSSEWDYGDNASLDPGEDVWIYPHIYYNPKTLFVEKTRFIVIWGFDATGGNVFREVYNEPATSGYAYSIIYKFYAGKMTRQDMLYVVDVCTIKEAGLVDNIVAAIRGGMSYQQIEDMWGIKLQLAERYCGRVSGIDGPPDYYYWIPSGIAPHQSHRVGGVWDTIKGVIKGFAIINSEETPVILRTILVSIIFGPMIALLGYITWTEVRSLIPFIRGG